MKIDKICNFSLYGSLPFFLFWQYKTTATCQNSKCLGRLHIDFQVETHWECLYV